VTRIGAPRRRRILGKGKRLVKGLGSGVRWEWTDVYGRISPRLQTRSRAKAANARMWRLG